MFIRSFLSFLEKLLWLGVSSAREGCSLEGLLEGGVESEWSPGEESKK